jgi:hypothetical protein
VLNALASGTTTDGKVFDIRVGHAFAKASEVAGIEDLRFRDLRHEALWRC